jgi:hypothetical protein
MLGLALGFLHVTTDRDQLIKPNSFLLLFDVRAVVITAVNC